MQGKLKSAKGTLKNAKQAMGALRETTKKLRQSKPEQPEVDGDKGDGELDEHHAEALYTWQTELEDAEKREAPLEKAINELQLHVSQLESQKVKLGAWKQQLDHDAANKKHEHKRRKLNAAMPSEPAASLPSEPAASLPSQAAASEPAASLPSQAAAAEPSEEGATLNIGAESDRLLATLEATQIAVENLSAEALDSTSGETGLAEVVAAAKAARKRGDASKPKVEVPPGVANKDKAAFIRAATDKKQTKLG
jgi:hypothetical protein